MAITSRCIVLFPDSRGRSWDMITGRRFGPDVEFLDAALAAVFSTCVVDTSRLCLAGFSDGATYALSLGLANGDLFTHLAAFSPGYVDPPTQVGTVRVGGRKCHAKCRPTYAAFRGRSPCMITLLPSACMLSTS